MRRLLVLALALAAAACSRPQEDTNALPPLSVPAAPPNAFYVGTWARSQADCAAGAWIVRPTALQSPAGACKFTRITPVQTGYAIDAECLWRQRPMKITMQAAYAQSAKALLLSGSPEGDIGLIACPPANSQTP